jgi:hypothetical protein
MVQLHQPGQPVETALLRVKSERVNLAIFRYGNHTHALEAIYS